MIALAVVAAFAVAAASTGWIVSRGGSRWLVDSPNERSLHHRPVSRAGGVAILAGLAAGFAVAAFIEAPASRYGWVLAGALIIGSISFADDVRRVSPAVRILFHFAAAMCVVPADLAVERLVLPGTALGFGATAGAVLTVLFVTWVVNLYNFMDGMDGFAGGMTAIGFTTLAVLCAHQDASVLVAASLVVASASLGFSPVQFSAGEDLHGRSGGVASGVFLRGPDDLRRTFRIGSVVDLHSRVFAVRD